MEGTESDRSHGASPDQQRPDLEPTGAEEAGRFPRRRKSRRTFLAVSVVLLVVAGVAAAGYFAWPRALPRAFAVVEAGRLYRSGLPTHDQFVRTIKQYGIRTDINLLTPKGPEYADEMATAKEHGLRFVSLPISSTKLMTEQQLATLRETYRDPRNYPILVHCEEGHARTGVAVVIWRVEQQGWDPARAVEEMIASGYPVRDKSVDMRNRLLHWDKSVQGAKQEAE